MGIRQPPRFTTGASVASSIKRTPTEYTSAAIVQRSPNITSGAACEVEKPTALNPTALPRNSAEPKSPTHARKSSDSITLLQVVRRVRERTHVSGAVCYLPKQANTPTETSGSRAPALQVAVHHLQGVQVGHGFCHIKSNLPTPAGITSTSGDSAISQEAARRLSSSTWLSNPPGMPVQQRPLVHMAQNTHQSPAPHVLGAKHQQLTLHAERYQFPGITSLKLEHRICSWLSTASMQNGAP